MFNINLYFDGFILSSVIPTISLTNSSSTF